MHIMKDCNITTGVCIKRGLLPFSHLADAFVQSSSQLRDVSLREEAVWIDHVSVLLEERKILQTVEFPPGWMYLAAFPLLCFKSLSVQQ